MGLHRFLYTSSVPLVASAREAHDKPSGPIGRLFGSMRSEFPQVRSPHRHARPAAPRLVHRQGGSGVFRLAGRASHDARQGGVRGAAAGSASRQKTHSQGGRLGPVFCEAGGHYRPRIFQGCPELWHLVMRSWPPPRYRNFSVAAHPSCPFWRSGRDERPGIRRWVSGSPWEYWH